jgi:hypothetical protein
MRNTIHYEEDLFYLTLLMKTLREGLQLPVDSEYFQEKFLGDLRFVGNTLDRLHLTLKANTSLIRRSEYLYNLVKAEDTYIELLAVALAAAAPGEARESLAEHRADFIRWRDSHDTAAHEIRTLLRLVDTEEERQDVITADELALLTKPEDPTEN